MKQILLWVVCLLACTTVYAQPQFDTTKTYELYAIAEGNFGTPNGDVYRVSTKDTTRADSMYAKANSGLGIDVLQDFQVMGNYAILLSKSSGFKVVVATFPGFQHVQTFTGLGAPQSIVKASNNRAYISCSNPSRIYKLDLTNTLQQPTAVVDTSLKISNATDYMRAANQFVYANYGTRLLKIDTASDSVCAVLTHGLGSVSGLVFDSARQEMWVLGKSGSTSALVRIEVGTTDVIHTAEILTGFTNAKLLEQNHDSLFYWSGKQLYAVQKQQVAPPTASVYTTTLTGGNFDFGYGKSFYVDQASGDFVIGSANGFASPSTYEVVNGQTFQRIDSGSVNGRIVNEFMLKTFLKGIEDTIIIDPIDTSVIDTTVIDTTIITPTGLHPVSVPASFKAYPNPVTDVLYISLPAMAERLMVFNTVGTLVLEQKVNGSLARMDMSQLPAGTYLLKVKGSGEVYTIRILKQ